MTTERRRRLPYFWLRVYRLLVMGVRRRTLRVGGSRSSPVNQVAKTFTPLFPDPSPLAVSSRLLMALGRAMGVSSLLPRQCRPPLPSRRSLPIISSRATQASVIGMPLGVVGPAEPEGSPFKRLRQSQSQSPCIRHYRWLRNRNPSHLWCESHRPMALTPTLFGRGIPSLVSQELTGELSTLSTSDSSAVTPTESSQGNVWYFPKNESSSGVSSQNNSRSPWDTVHHLRDSDSEAGRTTNTVSAIRRGHSQQPLRLVVDNSRCFRDHSHDC